jgi:putative FmdB family regulatory protein
MPTYVYRRDDGTKFKTQQRITEEPLEECPETGQSVERIITGQPGVILDGDTSAHSADEMPSFACAGGGCGL